MYLISSALARKRAWVGGAQRGLCNIPAGLSPRLESCAILTGLQVAQCWQLVSLTYAAAEESHALPAREDSSSSGPRCAGTQNGPMLHRAPRRMAPKPGGPASPLRGAMACLPPRMRPPRSSPCTHGPAQAVARHSTGDSCALALGAGPGRRPWASITPHHRELADVCTFSGRRPRGSCNTSGVLCNVLTAKGPYCLSCTQEGGGEGSKRFVQGRLSGGHRKAGACRC